MKNLYLLIVGILLCCTTGCEDDTQLPLEAGTIVFASPNCNDFIIETSTGKFKPSNLRQEFERDQQQVIFSFNLTQSFHSCGFLGDLPIIDITSIRNR